MKKSISLLLTIIMIFSLTACGQSSSNKSDKSNVTTGESEVTTTAKPAKTPDTNNNILIVYFSWSTSGNTEKMANTIKENIGGDILKIEPSNPYPTDYSECGDVAKKERDENARPEIANLPKSIEKYDTVFIGYPIWWHTAPMIIGTFLEGFNLSGKEIYPFSQSASMDTEQFENSMDFIRKSAKGATVHNGLFADASDTEEITAYLADNGFKK